MGFIRIYDGIPSGKRLHFANWKITMLSMGKSTISTGPFSIATCNKLPEGIPSYIPLNPIKSHFQFPHENHQFGIRMLSAIGQTRLVPALRN